MTIKKYQLGNVGIPNFDWAAYDSSNDFRRRVKDAKYLETKALYDRSIPSGVDSLVKDNRPGTTMMISRIMPVRMNDTSIVIMCITTTGYSFDLDIKKDKFLIEYFYDNKWTLENAIDFYENCSTDYAAEIADSNIPVVFNRNRQPDIDKAVQSDTKDRLAKQLNLPSNKKTLYRSTVTSVNSGGLNVDINGLECFLPISQSGIMVPRNVDRSAIIDILNNYIGEPIDVVIYGKGRQGSLIVSNREYTALCVREAKDALKASDDILYQGKITGVTYFGIFIECEAPDHILPSGQPLRFSGLLHTTVMSDELYHEHQNSKLFVGEQIAVYINSIVDDSKYNLSDLKSEEAAKISVIREEEKALRKALEKEQGKEH